MFLEREKEKKRTPPSPRLNMGREGMIAGYDELFKANHPGFNGLTLSESGVTDVRSNVL